MKWETAEKRNKLKPLWEGEFELPLVPWFGCAADANSRGFDDNALQVEIFEPSLDRDGVRFSYDPEHYVVQYMLFPEDIK